MNVGNTPTTSLLNGLLLGRTAASAKTGPGEAIWDTGHEGHLITVAPTGSGKGVSCIIPALLTWQGPAVVIDPRGENVAVTARHRRAMGHQVLVLDPYGVTDEPQSASLNPMDLLDPNSDDFEDDCALIAHLLVQDKLSTIDPFWDERAAALIITIIKALYTLYPYKTFALQDIKSLLVNPHAIPSYRDPTDDAKTFDHKFQMFAALFSETEFSSGRTRSSIFSSASSHLGFLRSTAVAKATSNSTIMLDDVRAGAMQTIYIVLPPDKLVPMAKLLRLWIGTILAAISRRRRLPPQPTLFIIDEAAQLGELDSLRAGLTLMRGYGMRLWTFWQDLSQLKNLYPRDWESILNNCSTQQFFGAKTPYAQRALKNYLCGTVSTDDLDTDAMVLCREGKVSMVARADYRTDPMLTPLAAPNPFYGPVDLPTFAKVST
ncbi:conserved exported protein of unknown function [Candidatus Filomicrobium marinum]|uniref:TRAG family protein n=1 Tax=Candidatus Filomicrobium marinum TaxID=1608628 RepID=A0A0D6JB26_9HYPH|nr:type IV secretory system conjugative DNA transfer family protein [Candidatus Filomicrobium marinum]CFX04980.1 conserved exported protein of unknown function [Candidatus Filomicrobium marinum]CPR16158.1 conserved exported protein of unknown function [Candidatus Filomicrobium marinum]